MLSKLQEMLNKKQKMSEKKQKMLSNNFLFVAISIAFAKV